MNCHSFHGILSPFYNKSESIPELPFLFATCGTINICLDHELLDHFLGKFGNAKDVFLTSLFKDCLYLHAGDEVVDIFLAFLPA